MKPVDQIINLGSHVHMTIDNKFEAKDRNIFASTNEMTTKAHFVLESSLLHFKYLNILDSWPDDIRFANSIPEPANIRSTLLKPLSFDVTPLFLILDIHT